jgi:hypothetical protein
VGEGEVNRGGDFLITGGRLSGLPPFFRLRVKQSGEPKPAAGSLSIC